MVSWSPTWASSNPSLFSEVGSWSLGYKTAFFLASAFSPLGNLRAKGIEELSVESTFSLVWVFHACVILWWMGFKMEIYFIPTWHSRYASIASPHSRDHEGVVSSLPLLQRLWMYLLCSTWKSNSKLGGWPASVWLHLVRVYFRNVRIDSHCSLMKNLPPF